MALAVLLEQENGGRVGPGPAARDHRNGAGAWAMFSQSLQEARARHGMPAIFDTDQGSQFTSLAFADMLENAGITFSMDGRGAWRDNVFAERL